MQHPGMTDEDVASHLEALAGLIRDGSIVVERFETLRRPSTASAIGLSTLPRVVTFWRSVSVDYRVMR